MSLKHFERYVIGRVEIHLLVAEDTMNSWKRQRIFILGYGNMKMQISYNI